jgi:hypothetical protein
MKICDNCSVITQYLQEAQLYTSVKNGDWKSITIELCPNCCRKLVEMEREAREHAILKSHSDFKKSMREKEWRNSLNYFVKTTQTTLRRLPRKMTLI